MQMGKFTPDLHPRWPHHRRAPSRGTRTPRCSVARPARAVPIFFTNLAMMKRLKFAIRVLLGLPLWGVPIDDLMMIDYDEESEFDFTKEPPFQLVFADLAPYAPPVKVLSKERFRVCIFQAKKPCDDCDKPCHWLVLELQGAAKWHHLVTMHECRLDVMMPVMQRVAAFVEAPEQKKPRTEVLE